MSLQIAMTTGLSNSINPWHEVENFKTILVQSLSSEPQKLCGWLTRSFKAQGGHLTSQVRDGLRLVERISLIA
jgi:hypothetical protein